MKTTTLLGLILAFAAIVSCKTADNGSDLSNSEDLYSVNSIQNDDSFRIWFSYYYIHKNSELTVPGILFMSKNNYLAEHPEIASTFLSHIFEDNSTQVKTWLAGLSKLPPRDWDVVLLALWLSNNKITRGQMKANLSNGHVDRQAELKLLSTKDNNTRLLNTQIDTPSQVNQLWAAFSATGSRIYVEKIISLVHLYETEEMSIDSIIGEAAIMTLANNAMQHKIVANICIQANSKHPDAKTRALLSAMLSAVTQISIDYSDVNR